MTKRVHVLAVTAAAFAALQVTACVDQPSSVRELDGPAQALAPSLEEVEGSNIRSSATMTLTNVAGASPVVLMRENMVLEGKIRNGRAMAFVRLGKGPSASVERMPLVRPRAKRRSFTETEKDEMGRDMAVSVEEAPNGTSRLEVWRDFEMLARVTYEYYGASGKVRRIVHESFANGKATTRLEITLDAHRVVDVGDADATAKFAAVERHAAVGALGSQAQLIPVAAVARGCYWRTLGLLVEAAGVGAACGAAITTAIVTAGVSVTACAAGGYHLMGALEDWLDDCAPAAT